MGERVRIVGNKNPPGTEAQHLPMPPKQMGVTSIDTEPRAEARVLAPVTPAFAEILSEPALQFVADLARRFEPRRRELLNRRAARQREFDAGAFPTFLPSTADVRDADWRVAPIPRDRKSTRLNSSHIPLSRMPP